MEKFLIKNGQTNGLRILGDNLDEITKEALKYIWRNKEYYEEAIPDEINLFGYCTVPHWNVSAPSGTITVIHDPYNFFNAEDIKLSGRDLYKKLSKYRIYRNNTED